MKYRATALLVLAGILAVGALAFLATVDRGLEQERRDSRRKLDAYADLFTSTLDKFKGLPFAISQNRTVLRLMEGRADAETASGVLKYLQEKSGASDIYVMDATGKTLAASNYGQPLSFVGNNYGYREYFKEAMAGGEGMMYAIGATSGVPGYYFSTPIVNQSGIVGVAAVKLELSSVSEGWDSGGGILLVIDPNGVIVISNRKEWQYRTLHPLSQERLARIRAGRVYKNKPLAPLAVSTGETLGAPWIGIDGVRYVKTEVEITSIGWTFVSLAPWAAFEKEAYKNALIAFLACLTVAAGALLTRAQRQKAISERRLLESRRSLRIDREREESLRLLADSIAHQIRNPLVGIGGNAMLLRKKPLEDEVLDRRLDTIIDCCKVLERVVASVREYIDLVPGTFRQTDLRALIEKARVQAETAIAPSKPAASWTIDLEPCEALVDQPLLRNALAEILANSLEAAHGKTVAITIAGRKGAGQDCLCNAVPVSERCYALSIADDGPGMEEEILAHATDPFFSTKPGGTGLGLAKAKRVMQIHHGGVELFSPPPGGPRTGVLARLILPVGIEPGEDGSAA